jgi:peptidoglycan/LPS O-acetylase OafA/YrhL
MCYTIYMYHWLLISLLLRFTGRLRTHVIWLDMLIQFVLITGGILVICAILFALFERPFMRRNWPETFRAKVRSMLRLKAGLESRN